MKKGIFITALFTFVPLMLTACAKKTAGTVPEQDWNPVVENETIEIEGLKNEYNFLFLTDSHMIVPDGKDSEEVREYSEKRLQEFGQAGTAGEGTFAEQFPLWIRAANEKKMDALLLGGDVIDYPSKSNLQYLKESLGSLEIPYLYTMGNHDWTYPWEYMTEEGKKKYLPEFLPFMENNEAIHCLEYEDLIIAAVDNSTNQINPQAMEEYEKILKKGKPVIVMLHVPLLTQSALTKAKESWKEGAVILGGGNYGGIYPDEISSKFIEMTTAENSPVAAVLAGHVHFQDRDMINSRIVQIVGDAGFRGKATVIRVKPALPKAD